MVIDNFRTEIRGDVERFAWAGIDRFKNKEFVTQFLCEIHNIPNKHKENAKKQAAQIRQCIIQASEYFQAAKGVSLATKPLLLYYGTMSLALAEILTKGSGGMSLDAARGKNAHHGLLLKVDGKPSAMPLLCDSAMALRAVPMINGATRTGTFHLWWNLSRESPVCGKLTTSYNGYDKSGTNILLGANDENLAELPDTGFSLLKCFRNTPYLSQELSDNGVTSELVPGSVEGWVNEKNNSQRLLTILNPSPVPIKEMAASKITYYAGDIEKLNLTDTGDGYLIDCNYINDDPIKFNFPNIFQWYNDELFICSDNNVLNEFGVYYLGSYILGNYARYFPDHWMSDIERSSPLYLTSAHFLEVLQRRVPLLAYSELSRAWMLMDR